MGQEYTGSNLLKFAVIGDINDGTETFENVVARLRKEEHIAFLVLLGDCAADPSQNLHTYFIEEFAETGFNLPTFVVAGNHDVEAGRFGYREFEKLYGSTDFSFLYLNNLFIGLGGIHDSEKLRETLTFLEKTLQEKRHLVNKVFVFMHYPLQLYDNPASQEWRKEFQNLFQQYKVTYVFSGHYHRYLRTDANGVVYLITGGGGGQLRRQGLGDIGLFHHLTIIEMKDNDITERIIPIPGASVWSRIMEQFERYGLTVLLPWVTRHTASAMAIGTIVMGCFLWGANECHYFLKRPELR
ncbi:MAG TPA: hypothetical protein DCR97_14665 [Deltaproteobacteria bacterium]|nr:hypothetical protein [Deltaproteobacteria bacterium]